MQVTDDNTAKTYAYIGSEENFRAIKRMEEANLIVPVTGNFGGPKALKAVGSVDPRARRTVTTFYTSNVEQYLFQDNIWRYWYDNVAYDAARRDEHVHSVGFNGRRDSAAVRRSALGAADQLDHRIAGGLQRRPIKQLLGRAELLALSTLGSLRFFSEV
jgi:hypothetical protein